MNVTLDLSGLVFKFDEPIVDFENLTITQKNKLDELIISTVKEHLSSGSKLNYADMLKISDLEYQKSEKLFEGKICIVNTKNSIDLGIIVKETKFGVSSQKTYFVYFPLLEKSESVNEDFIYDCPVENQRVFFKRLHYLGTRAENVNQLKNFALFKSKQSVYLGICDLKVSSSFTLINLCFTEEDSFSFKSTTTNSLKYLQK